MDSKEILKRLEEIEARAEKATPGPWRATVIDGEQYIESESGLVDIESESGLVVYQELTDRDADWPRVEPDFAFIAHSREDVPWLCKTVRQLVAQLENLGAVAEAARRVQLLLHRQFEWQTLEREMPGLLGAMVDLGRALRALEEEK